MASFATVIFITALVSANQAVSTKRDRSSAVSKLLRGRGPSKVDTSELVGSLSEVAKGLQSEGDRNLKLVETLNADCKKTHTEITLSLDKDQRAFDVATEDYQKAWAQVSSLKANKDDLKGKIADSNNALNELQVKLKKMRQDQGLIRKSASSSLRQINSVIDQIMLRTASSQHKSQSALDLKVSTLEKLSKSLSLLQMQQKVDMRHHKSAPTLILSTDKQTLREASDKAQKGFEEEEKQVLELIEVERKKLKDLEENLAEVQPTITDKLKEVLEINMTHTAAERGIARSKDLLHIESDKCNLVDHFMEEQKKSRDAVVNDVNMATKLIEHMDTALFLARDIQSLKPTAAAPSLLQLASTKHEEKSLASSPYSLLQEADTSGMGLQQLIESYSASMGTSEGPFDKVTRMISGLIASLKAEANDAVNQNQFCQDSLGENRNDRVEKQADIDSLAATIRWSEMAIVRLTDDVDYLKGEKQHMVDLEDKAKKALTKETSRVDRELHEHGLGYQVITKAVEVLTQLCDLGSSASSFIQHDSDLHTSEISTMQGRNSKAVSRLEQCKEAADLLTSGAKELKKLDGITNDYISEYKSMSDGVNDHAKKAQDAVSSQLKSTISAKAQRASELATANKEIKQAKKDLALIETSKKQLEHQCSHVETREEKMARRQDEIDALKEALNVLDGESVAVA